MLTSFDVEIVEIPFDAEKLEAFDAGMKMSTTDVVKMVIPFDAVTMQASSDAADFVDSITSDAAELAESDATLRGSFVAQQKSQSSAAEKTGVTD